MAKIVFTSPKMEESIFDWGTINVDLGEKLFKVWQDAGSVGENMQVSGKYEIRVLNSGGWIVNLALTSKQLHTISVQFQRNSKQSERNAIFFLDLTQYDFKDQMMGGQRFILKTLSGISP